MEQKKLSEEELDEIKKLNNDFNSSFAKVGLIQIQIAELEARRENAYNEIIELRNTEQKLFEKLKEKYGEGTIDINTGVFNSEN
jgi:hypothetical protein